MSSVEERLQALETRLQESENRLRDAEDRLAIADLVARYGPAVDTLNGQAAAALWTETGTYTIGDDVVQRADIAGVVDFDAHLAYVNAGCGHVLSPARIDITGDTAVAVNYSLVVMYEQPRWVVDRMSANRWECVRTAEGWRVQNRSNRMITGTPEARELLS